MDKARIVKFCIQVDCIKSYLLDEKPRAWSDSHDPFSVLTSAILSLERLKRESPNFVCRRNISSASLRMTD